MVYVIVSYIFYHKLVDAEDTNNSLMMQQLLKTSHHSNWQHLLHFVHMKPIDDLYSTSFTENV